MDLSKKRDELNPYIEQYGYAEVFNKGFDAAVEILSAEIKELEKALEKFITKSNGLSFWVRNSHLKNNLSKNGEFNDLVERLESLYDFQCEAELTLSKLRGGK